MSTPDQTFDLDEFKNALLSEHNDKRAQHHAPALILDAGLNADAQAWAEHLLSQGQLVHDDNRGGAGENLYMTTRALPFDPPLTQEMIDLYTTHFPDFVLPTEFTGPSLAAGAASAWYSEVANYSYATTRSINGDPIGHFTQLVWKASIRLGCGAAWKLSGNGANVTAYVVCRYQSAGNRVQMAPGQSYDEARLQCYGDHVIQP